MNSRKPSLVVTQQGCDAAAAQGLCQRVGLGNLNWAATGGMLGLAQPLALQQLTPHHTACLQSHPKSFPVGRLPAKKLPFHSHVSILARLSKGHLQGLVQSCPAWDTGAAAWAEGKEEPSWHEEIVLETRIFQQERTFQRV